MITFGTTGCTNNDYDYNPEDYVRSPLSGEYGTGKLWTLNIILNGDSIRPDGYVRFEAKPQTEYGDFKFVKVIPGESLKEFKQVPLTPSEAGLKFVMDFPRKTGNVHISGTVRFSDMTVYMTLSE